MNSTACEAGREGLGAYGKPRRSGRELLGGGEGSGYLWWWRRHRLDSHENEDFWLFVVFLGILKISGIVF